MRQGRGRDVVRVDCCRRNVSEGECVASAGTYRKANVFQKIHKNFQIVTTVTEKTFQTSYYILTETKNNCKTINCIVGKELIIMANVAQVDNLVNLNLCRHINAAGRFIKDHHTGIPRQPLCYNNLLLIAA